MCVHPCVCVCPQMLQTLILTLGKRENYVLHPTCKAPSVIYQQKINEQLFWEEVSNLSSDLNDTYP